MRYSPLSMKLPFHSSLVQSNGQTKSITDNNSNAKQSIALDKKANKRHRLLKARLGYTRWQQQIHTPIKHSNTLTTDKGLGTHHFSMLNITQLTQMLPCGHH